MANARDCSLANAVGWILLTVIPLACDPGHAANSSPSSAAPPAVLATIAPGATRVFTIADGGRTACAGLVEIAGNLPPAPSTESNCALSLVRYGSLFNDNDSNLNQVWARAAEGPPPSNLIPSRAQSGVYNDFSVQDEYTVSGWRSSIVDAQIAVTFDLAGTLTGLSVYSEKLSASLVVEDVTDVSQPIPIGTLELVAEGRDGDQGITDVSGTLERVTVDDETNGFLVKLRRGHTYRVWFQLEASSFGSGIAAGSAQWSTLVVSIDEDTTEFNVGSAIETLQRISIEENLKQGNALASLYLPNTHGGQLDAILGLVDNLIETSIGTGLDAHNSPYFMELAHAEADAGNFRTAFERASTAYRLLTQ